MSALIRDLLKDYQSQISSLTYLEYCKDIGNSWSDYQKRFKQNSEEYLKLSPGDLLIQLSADGAISSPLFDSMENQMAVDWHYQTWYSAAIEQTRSENLLNRHTLTLDDLRYFAYLKKIESNLLPLKGNLTYLEIGAGNGGFLKFLKGVNPALKAIIVDIPEVIFASRLQMAIAFPAARQVLAVSEQQLSEALKDSTWEVLFLDPSLFHHLERSELSIDLFVNTRSMGEMRKRATQKFSETLGKLHIENIFLENRYLNGISFSKELLLHFRRDEYTGSLFMGNLWHLVDFDIEPIWTKSPWEKFHPRYLSLCMNNKPALTQQIDAVTLTNSQSWRSGVRNPWNSVSHPTTLDNLSLSKLFDEVRLHNRLPSLVCLLEFINYHFNGKFIEEEQYYFRKLREISLLSFSQFTVGRLQLIFKFFVYWCRDTFYRRS